MLNKHFTKTPETNATTVPHPTSTNRNQPDWDTLWAGDFGNQYNQRIDNQEYLPRLLSLFSRTLSKAQPIKSAIELGPNTGQNLMALHQLFPKAELTGVELNDRACEKLLELGYVKVHHCSYNDFSSDKTWDLVLMKGAMIYQPDELLPDLYSRMYKLTRRYVLICEFYSPYPVDVPYRGESFCKRDFAGEMMDMFPSLRLADYGFVYHRDNNFPLLDFNWFLLEKYE